jgi:hypothetical protein
MQPPKSQAHQVRSEGRANDEAGEQVAVQLTETLHSEIPRREETDHVNFGPGCQAEADDACDGREGAIEQVNSEARQQEEEGRDERRENPVDKVSR